MHNNDNWRAVWISSRNGDLDDCQKSQQKRTVTWCHKTHYQNLSRWAIKVSFAHPIILAIAVFVITNCSLLAIQLGIYSIIQMLDKYRPWLLILQTHAL